MFKDVSPLAGTAQVQLNLNGYPVTVPAGYTVAAALLLQQRHSRTSIVSDTSRGPYCMMGNCFECLVEIDGVANVQACMVEVQAGMDVRTAAIMASARVQDEPSCVAQKGQYHEV